MIILLEGPDKCGKSTFARRLSKKLNVPIRKHSETGSAQEASAKTLDTLQDYRGGIEIWDRFYFPSDLIYGPIAGGYEIPKDIKSYYWEYVQEKLRRNRTLIVYFKAPKSVILQRLKEEPDHYVDEDKLKKIIDKYECVMDKVRLPKIELNSHELNAEEMVSEFYKSYFKMVSKGEF